MYQIMQRVRIKLSVKAVITVANFSMNSSEAPREANPISWENSAKAGSANSGT